QAQEESRQRLEDQRRELLRAARERRCTAEQMCQGLPCHQVDWEESPGKLLEMLEGKSLGISPLSPIEAWLGVHADRRSARKVYLLLARKWHPDKWAVQGERCVSFATEVAKQLVWAYEQACIHLPNAPAPRGFHAQEDDDENRECYEFASWVGISFNGMEEVWKERLAQGTAASRFGLLRRRRPLRIAVTGVPTGLTAEQQARLARAPFLIPWEFLPFHSGRVVLI
ncbi:unnamed protein product, partial [Effrenium voratum]